VDLHEIFREGWEGGPVNNWLHFGGDPHHCLYCFPDSSLLGDTENG